MSFRYLDRGKGRFKTLQPGDITPHESFPLSLGNQLKIIGKLDGNHRDEMIKDLQSGMEKRQKSIPPKYFYDHRGSQLFEQICITPEYYPTKTEFAILEDYAAAIMEFFREEGGDLIELGSGSNQKIRRLLDRWSLAEHQRIRYVPVDISESSLIDSAHDLLKDYERLEILGVIADFTRHISILPRGRKLITFFGSTIGNFTEREAVRLFRSIRSIMGAEDRFLLGMDMLKPVEVIESAYNDRQGVTGNFNRNILEHINRELKGDFDGRDFDHWAYFNPEREWVEMHLRARRPVRVRLDDLSLAVNIQQGETIHTEISRKFSWESAHRLFRMTGMTVSRWFTDPKGWFSLVELQTQNE